MKNISIKIIALVFAFLLGVSFVVIYYFYSTPEVSKPALTKTEKNFDCAEQKSFPGLSQKISEIEKSESGYFPKKIFYLPNRTHIKGKTLDEFIDDWYGKHLTAMEEISLFDDSYNNSEVYRFLRLESFGHTASVKVERFNANSFYVTYKELDGRDDIEPGKIFRRESHPITKEQWCKFIQILDKAEYWELPAQIDDSRLDGAEWILEGVKDGRYHVVDRWSPKSGDYREACEYLVKIFESGKDRLKGDLY